MRFKQNRECLGMRNVDGSPDMRWRANQDPLPEPRTCADGTPDMRFKQNRECLGMRNVDGSPDMRWRANQDPLPEPRNLFPTQNSQTDSCGDFFFTVMENLLYLCNATFQVLCTFVSLACKAMGVAFWILCNIPGGLRVLYKVSCQVHSEVSKAVDQACETAMFVISRLRELMDKARLTISSFLRDSVESAKNIFVFTFRETVRVLYHIHKEHVYMVA
jgi:hypothetical protein